MARRLYYIMTRIAEMEPGHPMPLPNLLIIGAMKSGTTGLYLDLAAHPRVYLPNDKEPHALRSDEVLGDAGRADYANYYSGASDGQVICDASTGYTKRPTIDGVAQRAVEILPAGFRVIYLVRHPIDRIVSQHFHEFTEGTVGPDIDAAVREHQRYIDYSRYAYQLEPWIDAVGPARIRVVRFEDYVAQRKPTVEQLWEFLELDPAQADALDEGIANRSEGKPVLSGLWRTFRDSWIYQHALRPFVSVHGRQRIRRLLLSKAPQRPDPPSDDTVDWLRHQLADDVLQLAGILDQREPFWPDVAAAALDPARRPDD